MTIIKLNDSINFLLKEIERLKLKEKNLKISKAEKETLKKLESFVGKND